MLTSIKSQAVRRKFAGEFWHCWACGICMSMRTPDIDYPRWLETHHIVKRGRSDSRANLSRLCKLCHDVVEGLQVRLANGERMPPLPLSAVLWLKSRWDAEHYDRPLLAALAGRAVPRATRPSEWYMRQLRDRAKSASTGGWRSREVLLDCPAAAGQYHGANNECHG